VSPRRVIRYSQLPTQPPTLLIALGWMMLDRYQPPGWVYGVVCTILGLFVLSFIYNFVWGETMGEVVFKKDIQ
jgi:hypothetical protein